MATDPTPTETDPTPPESSRDDIVVTENDDDLVVARVAATSGYDPRSHVVTEEPSLQAPPATPPEAPDASDENEGDDDDGDGDAGDLPAAASAEAHPEATDPAGDDTKDDKAGTDKPKSRRARKTARLQKENSELRDRVAVLENAAQEPPTPDEPLEKPIIDDFPSYELYGEALGKYEFEKLQAENAPDNGASGSKAKPVPPSWGEIEDKYPDFVDNVYDKEKSFFTVPIVNQLVDMGTEGAEVAYYLSKNPDEAKRIAQVTGETAIARELTKAAAKAAEGSKATGNGGQPITEQAATVAPTITNAPPPITRTAGGGAQGRTVDLETCSEEEYRATRRRQMDAAG